MRIFLLLIPILSFGLQLYFSFKIGTLDLFFHHYNVSIVDWIFIPINLIAYKIIRWDRADILFQTLCITLTLSCIVHHQWAMELVDPGHMITKEQVMLPSGWVHLIFTAVELAIVSLALLFPKKGCVPRIYAQHNILFSTYLISSLLASYGIHGSLRLEDALRSIFGIAVILYIHKVKVKDMGQKSA